MDLYIIRDPLKHIMLKYIYDLNIKIVLVDLGIIDEFTMNKAELREYLMSSSWSKNNCKNHCVTLTQKGYWKMFNKNIYYNSI